MGHGQLPGTLHWTPSKRAKSRSIGRVGRQRIVDTGPLARKRMETIDDETANAAVDFIQRQVRAAKPFFVWWNATRMHLYTHVRPQYRGRSGISEYMDGMLEHDGHVGQLLKALEDLGIANDTIVVYTTDNGPHMNSWPDGAMTPFRGEKNTNWEGAFRVPAFVRWPGRIRRVPSPTTSSRASTGFQRCSRPPAIPA
jgi:arylsulfatase